MFKSIIGIINSLLRLFVFNKTEKAIVSAEKKNKEQQQFDEYTDDIKNAHETDDLDKLRKLLGD